MKSWWFNNQLHLHDTKAGVSLLLRYVERILLYFPFFVSIICLFPYIYIFLIGKSARVC